MSGDIGGKMQHQSHDQLSHRRGGISRDISHHYAMRFRCGEVDHVGASRHDADVAQAI